MRKPYLTNAAPGLTIQPYRADFARLSKRCLELGRVILGHAVVAGRHLPIGAEDDGGGDGVGIEGRGQLAGAQAR